MSAANWTVNYLEFRKLFCIYQSDYGGVSDYMLGNPNKVEKILHDPQFLLNTIRKIATSNGIDLNWPDELELSIIHTKLSLLTKKGKLRKPRANLEFVGNVSYQSLDEMMNLKTIRAQLNYDEESMTERSLNINEGIINLEEVVVTEKRPVKNTFQISAQVQGTSKERPFDSVYEPVQVNSLRQFIFIEAHCNDLCGVTFLITTNHLR